MRDLYFANSPNLCKVCGGLKHKKEMNCTFCSSWALVVFAKKIKARPAGLPMPNERVFFGGRDA